MNRLSRELIALEVQIILAKLKETAGSMIGKDIFIMNMERLFRRKVLFLFLYAFFEQVIIIPVVGLHRLENTFLFIATGGWNELLSMPK